jgi:imidazole glycerol-phosphate synthase subunit HisF
MVKPRLIFTLLLESGSFMLSRNFTLQRVGDLDWLRESYDFDSIALSIDELVVLDVTRRQKDIDTLAQRVSDLAANCFMPIAAGGGILSMDTAYRLFAAGADKLVVNTALVKAPQFVRELVRVFGGQSIIASIDYRNVGGVNRVFVENGTVDAEKTLDEFAAHAAQLGVGELYVTSMQQDGTGQGYDLETLKELGRAVPLPVIASGGVGKPQHLLQGLREAGVQAVSTANLFNFIADGLAHARQFLISNQIPLPVWSRFSV